MKGTGDAHNGTRMCQCAMRIQAGGKCIIGIGYIRHRVLLATPVSTVPSIHLLTMVFDFQPEDLFPDNTTDYTNQEPGFHRHAVDLALFCRGLDYQ